MGRTLSVYQETSSPPEHTIRARMDANGAFGRETGRPRAAEPVRHGSIGRFVGGASYGAGVRSAAGSTSAVAREIASTGQADSDGEMTCRNWSLVKGIGLVMNSGTL